MISKELLDVYGINFLFKETSGELLIFQHNRVIGKVYVGPVKNPILPFIDEKDVYECTYYEAKNLVSVVLFPHGNKFIAYRPYSDKKYLSFLTNHAYIMNNDEKPLFLNRIGFEKLKNNVFTQLVDNIDKRVFATKIDGSFQFFYKDNNTMRALYLNRFFPFLKEPFTECFVGTIDNKYKEEVIEFFKQNGVTNE